MQSPPAYTTVVMNNQALMTVPEFPDSRELTLEDKPLFDRIFAADPPELSAYTFTNIFAWRQSYDTRLSRIGDCLLVHYNRDGLNVCLAPLGTDCARDVIEEAFSKPGDTPVEFAYLPTGLVESFRGDKRYEIRPDRDNWDYLYKVSDLIDLPGRRYDGKRNWLARAKSRSYEYLVMDGRMAIECHEFVERWCQDRDCDEVDGLRREKCAVYQMLTNFDRLSIRGGVIRMGDEIVAISLGESLNSETLVIHVEKADANIEGLYQLINNEFCIHEAKQFRFVNREQDLGVPGLRKAKESYHPVRLVESWRLRAGE